MDDVTQILEREDEVEQGVATGRSSQRRWISEDQIAALRRLDHFGNSRYGQLDLNRLLDEYICDFVEPLLKLNAAPRAVADVGTGYGWLAIAFALRTHARVVAIEYDGRRLEAARRIAEILGVADRIEWLQGSIADLPLPDRSMDAVYCIEVIEHTGVQAKFVKQLCRISKDVLVITTPNKLFPVINHDTALPFCHWMPLRARDLYAAAFHRRDRQDNNQFWSPMQLFGSMSGFQRVSRFMQFGSYAEYRDAHPPRDSLSQRCLAAYMAVAACLGRYSIYALPNLASTFRRID